MEAIFQQLPKAIRWSKILSVLFLLATLFFLLIFVVTFLKSAVAAFFQLIPLLLMGFQYWLFRGYKIACQQALDSRDIDDLETAARKQVMIIKFFGFLSLLILILMLFGLIGMFFGGIQAVQFGR